MNMDAKPVLVATDLSARCDRAVDRAISLATERHTRLKVVHVLETEAKDEKEIEKRVRASLPEPEADFDILTPHGAAPDAIVETAEKAGVDIVVTGVARYNHLRDFFLGTAVDHVIRHAGTPVLVVKERARHPYRKLLVATDLSSCSRAALLTVAAMFPDAAIHIVHAYRVPYEAWLTSNQVRREVEEEARADLRAFLDHPDIAALDQSRIQSSIGFGDTVVVLADKLTETGSDLLVLGTHGRSGFAHATIGSTAENLLRWLDVDTLMVREDQ